MTTRRFAGRCAVVTGGGDGIGRAMARRFAAEGAGVIVAEFDRDSGESAAEEFRAGGGEARFVATDVADKAQVMAMMAQAAQAFGGVDILVNNAYRGQGVARFESKSDEVFATALAMNLDDARYLTGDTLFADGGGHISGVAWAPDLGE